MAGLRPKSELGDGWLAFRWCHYTTQIDKCQIVFPALKEQEGPLLKAFSNTFLAIKP